MRTLRQRGGPGRPLNSRLKLFTALREALDENDTLERLRRAAILLVAGLAFTTTGLSWF